MIHIGGVNFIYARTDYLLFQVEGYRFREQDDYLVWHESWGQVALSVVEQVHHKRGLTDQVAVLSLMRNPG